MLDTNIPHGFTEFLWCIAYLKKKKEKKKKLCKTFFFFLLHNMLYVTEKCLLTLKIKENNIQKPVFIMASDLWLFEMTRSETFYRLLVYYYWVVQEGLLTPLKLI